jgi:hypothetical protein
MHGLIFFCHIPICLFLGVMYMHFLGRLPPLDPGLDRKWNFGWRNLRLSSRGRSVDIIEDDSNKSSARRVPTSSLRILES